VKIPALSEYINHIIAKKLGEIPQNATVLTINYDTGERYWSVDGLFEENIISE